jgi:DNA polymerase III beta subunit
MKTTFAVSAPRLALKDALTVLAPSMSKRNTLPILSTTRLIAADGTLHITTTDLDTYASATVDADVKTPGDTCIPFAAWRRCASVMASPSLELTQTDFFRVDGVSSALDVLPVEADQFPLCDFQQDVGADFTVSATALANMLALCPVFCHPDESRSLLMGFHLVFDSTQLRFEATDTHKLAQMWTPIEHAVSANQTSRSIIVRPGVHKVLELAIKKYKPERVRVQTTAMAVRFSFDRFEVVGLLMDGQFPNTEKVVPRAARMKAVVKRKNLLDAMSGAYLCAPYAGCSNKIQLEFNPRHINGFYGRSDIHGSEGTRYKMRVDEVLFEGEEEFEAAFNVKYFADALRVFPFEWVQIEMNSQLQPILLSGYDMSTKDRIDGMRAVLMPMQGKGSSNGSHKW